MVQTFFEVMMSAWMCGITAHLHAIQHKATETHHVRSRSIRGWKTGRARKVRLVRSLGKVEEEVGSRRIVITMAWNMWLIACLLASVPSALYATLKAIPGLMRVNTTLQFAVNQSVVLFNAALTTFVLPVAASLLCSHSEFEKSESDLLIIGQLVATLLIPSALTIIFHADCLGAWVFFWQPCAAFTSSMGAWSNMRFAVESSIPGMPAYVNQQLLSRSEVCELNANIERSRCTDAVLEHLMQLFLVKMVHLTFTFTSFRILSRKRIRFKRAYVLLAYVWSIAMMLGPCIPLLIPLSLLFAAVHTTILFNQFNMLHKQHHTDTLRSLSQADSQRCALVAAVCLQCCLVP
eukprot:2390343-Amphidinium_carterae.1